MNQQISNQQQDTQVLNKAEIQNLKSFLTKLGEDELITIFNTFLQISQLSIERQCKMISYKCYESTYSCKQKKANGYGRNEKEANINCIRNILEFLLEDSNIALLFKKAIKQISNQGNKNQDNNEQSEQQLEENKLQQQQQQFQQQQQLQQTNQFQNQTNTQIQNNLVLPNLDPQQQAQLIEELKRSKNYITHLEKKVNLVMEENKILKQLLLENKKQQQNSKQTKENQPPLQSQQQNQQMSIDQLSKQNSYINTNQNSSVKQQSQILSNKKQNMNTSSHLISQPYEILHKTSKHELSINMNNISVNNTNYNTNQKPQQQEQLQEIQQQQNPQNQKILFETLQNNIKPVTQNYNPQISQNNTNQNFFQSQEDLDDKKLRSLSVDITQANKRVNTTQNDSCNKVNTNQTKNLDISCDNIKVKKSKKSVPKLNLTILPNYHGKNGNKSLNQLLQQQKFWCK